MASGHSVDGPPRRSSDQVESGDPTVALLAIAAMRKALDEHERRAVAIARKQDMSWAEIAHLLGQARQSPWRRYRALQ